VAPELTAVVVVLVVVVEVDAALTVSASDIPEPVLPGVSETDTLNWQSVVVPVALET
jgi:hypothetical protein